ncbi:phosphatidate cytidylyltransferase [candidate division KSB1 bacterium]|nr:phosphatidate cytidylyltransferase [candidate division KSB1 bacterium]
MQPLFSPVWLWNTLVAIVEIIYIFVIIGAMDKLVARGFPSDLSRKIIHIAAGSYVIFWPLFDVSHWSKYFCVLMPLIWVMLFLSKGLSDNREDPAVKTMTRTGDPRELLRGPLMFALVMVVLGLLLFNRVAAVVALGMLTWGDGLAPYIGKHARHTYRTLGPTKSWLGSATVFIAGVAGAALMLWITGLSGDAMPWRMLAVTGAVVMIAEAFSPRDVDNLLIPLVSVAMVYLQTGAL